MGAPRIPEIIYRYTRYHLGATVEFLKQCDGIYGVRAVPVVIVLYIATSVVRWLSMKAKGCGQAG